MHFRLFSLLLTVLPFVALVSTELSGNFECDSAPAKWGPCGIGISFQFHSS
ncbi:predicted protein [Pyrenophora tritici-repentis Pt-1C-BFP]|uniref:Uncharacterized protein n=1 Tax=Pyrenophora tritici-repentis (strain Pt-1C-BFP) TaxID=426418 RepID=B2WM14_PYRTR|nr:uncharacterized protein PTRG_11024 [Pyrenophora tritici-repentis Pt-1C-BFP]EDU44074.1 predicted protein [Pyrenophora tritici-repentis Pt-1C-BFP]